MRWVSHERKQGVLRWPATQKAACFLFFLPVNARMNEPLLTGGAPRGGEWLGLGRECQKAHLMAEALVPGGGAVVTGHVSWPIQRRTNNALLMESCGCRTWSWWTRPTRLAWASRSCSCERSSCWPRMRYAHGALVGGHTTRPAMKPRRRAVEHDGPRSEGSGGGDEEAFEMGTGTRIYCPPFFLQRLSGLLLHPIFLQKGRTSCNAKRSSESRSRGLGF